MRTLPLHLGSVLVGANLQILSPVALVEKFNSTNSTVQVSTAAFGEPFFGQRVIGEVFYMPSNNTQHPHCSAKDYVNYTTLAETMKKRRAGAQLSESGGDYAPKPILLVKRGGCSFVTKVREAQDYFGAQAVIVQDEPPPRSYLSSETIQTVVMSGDGYESHIKIPSVLMSNLDGEKIVSEISAHPAESVIVEMDWGMPVRDMVVFDMWMSSSSPVAYHFLQEFKPFVEKFLHHFNFVPHYHVYDLPSDYNNLCYKDGMFCADDPDTDGPIEGRDVVLEDLRQWCIWDVTAENDPENSRVKISGLRPSENQVRRSKKFWEYISQIQTRCRLDGGFFQPKESRFGNPKCSEKLMVDVGVDPAKVNLCMEDQGMKILTHQRNNVAWSPLAIRINGARFAGHTQAGLVARAICTGFSEPPQACKELQPSVPSARSEFALGSVLGTVVSIALLVAMCGYLFTRVFFRKYIRQALQEEVMLEVQSQMSEYRTLDSEDGLGQPRLARLPRWA